MKERGEVLRGDDRRGKFTDRSEGVLIGTVSVWTDREQSQLVSRGFKETSPRSMKSMSSCSKCISQK